ncbi:hypothetical protein MKZ38_009572 [Zalerion maritima]|uniref:Uncharacterized protein n=1 Tax=Zalerion maritima TaxID=339359 RepID=A0AAD5RT53_9PEZI|nr:hypothetical protein MKZ38_009572 [Zalerion maritima]
MKSDQLLYSDLTAVPKMPKDPYLYGRPPAKKKKTSTKTPSNMSFAAQMASLISTSSSSTLAAAKPRSKTSVAADTPPGQKKDSIFTAKVKRKDKVEKDDPRHPDKIRLKSPTGTHDEVKERERARQKMEAKAKMYDAMKRGELLAGDGERAPLVDFDQKWANRHDPNHRDYAPSSSESEDEDAQDNRRRDDEEELVEWEDEFGRLRRGTRAEKDKHDRRIRRGLLGQEELERISARPAAPQQVIYGDTVQTDAFKIMDEAAMEALARKRDKSATPPPDSHYNVNLEVRDKGVGFYAFSQTEEKRKEEMSNLEKERLETERRRVEKEDPKAKRKRQMEERKQMIDGKRRQMEDKKAKAQADEFLAGLGMEMGNELSRATSS